MGRLREAVRAVRRAMPLDGTLRSRATLIMAIAVLAVYQVLTGLTFFMLVAVAALLLSWVINERARRTAADTEEALRASEGRLLEEQATLRMVAGVARDIATKPDARSSICAATIEVVGSTFASLWEVEGDSRLTLSAMEGADVPAGLTIEIGKEPSGAAIAFLSRKRYFARDARDNPSVSMRMVAATGAQSLLFEPVHRGDEVIGVLAVGWSEHAAELSPREGSLISLLADEAAVAIERSDMMAQLAALARTDPLTGLPNRRVWEERLPIEIARAERSDDGLSLLVVDLDDFKAVNDDHGHQAGDRMLKEVAASWRDVIRPTDLLARFGGDEFVVLLPGSDSEAAAEFGDRLREAMPRGLTCSVGVVEWSGDPAHKFLARGDAALYEAKTLGRDRTAAR